MNGTRRRSLYDELVGDESLDVSALVGLSSQDFPKDGKNRKRIKGFDQCHMKSSICQNRLRRDVKVISILTGVANCNKKGFSFKLFLTEFQSIVFCSIPENFTSGDLRITFETPFYRRGKKFTDVRVEADTAGAKKCLPVYKAYVNTNGKSARN